MNKDDKKLIIFKRDCDTDEKLGDICFVKFLDEEERYAVFYMPLVAPKHFKSFIKENNILEAYEVNNSDVLLKYEDKIHTFNKEEGVYVVTKGIELTKKRVLLVDSGMNLKLPLPTYSYELIDDSIHIYPIKHGSIEKSFCYVEDEDKINPILKNIMLPVTEAVPGILNINTYPYVPSSKVKYKKK